MISIRILILDCLYEFDFYPNKCLGYVMNGEMTLNRFSLNSSASSLL